MVAIVCATAPKLCVLKWWCCVPVVSLILVGAKFCCLRVSLVGNILGFWDLVVLGYSC
jgi:hypothetical protein